MRDKKGDYYFAAHSKSSLHFIMPQSQYHWVNVKEYLAHIERLRPVWALQLQKSLQKA